MCRIQPSSVFLDYWTMSRMWLDLIVELESILADFFWKLVAHSVQNKVAWIFNLHPVVFSQFVSIISAVTLGLLVFPHIKKLHSRHTSWFSGRSAFQEGPKLSTKNTLLILNPQWMTNLGGLIQSLAMESPTIISRKANGPNAYNIFWKIQGKMAVQLGKASLLKPWDSLLVRKLMGLVSWPVIWKNRGGFGARREWFGWNLLTADPGRVLYPHKRTDRGEIIREFRENGIWGGKWF